MKLSQRQLIIIAAGVGVFAAFYFLFTTSTDPDRRPPEVSLTVWGVEEDGAFRDLFAGYQALNTNVKFDYKKISETNYEDQVLNALASNEGPDILMLHSRSLPTQKSKLTPIDPQLFGVAKLRSLFPEVVEMDFMSEGQIYALPLFIDTLALFYNKDYFDTAAITGPPRSWKDFQDFIPFLRSLNQNNQITRAGAAIGGSEKSVKHAVDILSLLFMQNGVEMTTPERTAVQFASGQSESDALAALNFYLQFANAASPYYTWNNNEENSLDSFVAGKTAMAFGYASDAEIIRKKSPFLKMGIAPMPQAPAATLLINYPSYWGLTVSKQSKNPDWAWDFILYSTTDPFASEKYLNTTKNPPALREIIGNSFEDPVLGIFARQALTARSWYQPDEDKVDSIFNNIIISILNGQLEPTKGLKQAQDQIHQLIQKSF